MPYLHLSKTQNKVVSGGLFVEGVPMPGLFESHMVTVEMLPDDTLRMYRDGTDMVIEKILFDRVDFTRDALVHVSADELPWIEPAIESGWAGNFREKLAELWGRVDKEASH